ncbi:MAG: putative TIM-barrel fold metal-dependent hydrolase [Planctomycetota bacterium]|jgi:predicted TIM-barrel fold metal-dependent hydrolase
MRIVDFHSHFFSRPFFETLAKLSPLESSPDELLAGLSEKTGIEIPSPDIKAHTDRWLAQMEQHGVDHLVAFASLPPEAPALVEARTHAAGKLSTMAVVDPGLETAPGKVAHLMKEGGFSGLLVFPAMHHFDLDGGPFSAVLDVVGQTRGVVYVHCGLLVVKLRDLLGLPRPYDLSYANPLALIPAANAHPDVSFVIPHFGAGFFREALMACAQCENIHLDTSSTNSWIRTQPGLTDLKDVFARALDVAGPERILFGTDSTVFPAGWRHERLTEQRAIADELGIDAAGQASIFGGNAMRLLGHD